MGKITSADLQQFTGTSQYYRSTMGSMKNTDGVQFLAEHAGAFWLLEAIASYQHTPEVKAEGFQLWELTVKDHAAVLTMKADSDQPAIVTKVIPFTDFPLDRVTLYLIDDVLMLPSEY